MTESWQDIWNGSRVSAVAFGPGGSRRPLDKYDGPLLMAGEGPVRFHVMAKPSGSTCNLACAYCFYRSKETLPNGPGAGRMSEETLGLFIRQYLEGVTAPVVTFTWQGGEPTLMGLDFFRKVVEAEREHARPGQSIENDLQTNGTLLNEDWCRFLKENRFLVGLSIDGPRDLHDAMRVAKDGSPTFDRVMRAVGLLKRSGVPFNTLTCVHRFNARHAIDIYRFLRDEVGSTRMQFTPVVEYRSFDRLSPREQAAQGQVRAGDPRSRPDHPESIVTDWSVDPDDWGHFLRGLFDRWVTRDVGKILVNQFETLVARRLGAPAQMCAYGEFCGKGVAVEHDGRVYSCDHFVYPDYQIGRLGSGNLRDTVLSRQQVKFGYAKSESLPKQCQQCPDLSDCRGECPKNRILRTADGEPGLNYLCRGLKAFYEHAIPEVDRIVAGLRSGPVRPIGRMRPVKTSAIPMIAV
jgi:uncharacterized protein